MINYICPHSTIIIAGKTGKKHEKAEKKEKKRRGRPEKGEIRPVKPETVIEKQVRESVEDALKILTRRALTAARKTVMVPPGFGPVTNRVLVSVTRDFLSARL
jgi:hypothetical protein